MEKHCRRSMRAAKAAALMAAGVLAVMPFNGYQPLNAPVYAAEESGSYLNGDSDGVNGIDAEDALAIMKHCTDLSKITGVNALAADSNCSGEIEVADAIYILQWLVMQDDVSVVGEYISMDSTAAPRKEIERGIFSQSSMPEEDDGYAEIGRTKGGGCTTALTVPEDGNYKLRIRYINDTGRAKQLYVCANGDPYAVLAEFPSTGGSSEWQEEIVIITLYKGVNNIAFLSPDNGDAIKLDYYSYRETIMAADNLTEMPSGIDATTTPVMTEPPVIIYNTTVTSSAPPVLTQRYYAVDAEYYNGVSETTNGGFEGSAYINYNNEIGSFVNWTVAVPTAGNYEVVIRYANGTDTKRTTKFAVNGSKDVYYMDFDSTGAWNTWEEKSVVLALNAGNNTIKATATTSDGGPNIDFIEITPTTEQASPLTESKDGRQVENLNRGVSAAYSGSGVLVSWRILATDSPNTEFKLYKNGKTPPIYEGSVDNASCYFDASGTASDVYTIDTYVNGEMTEFAQASINLGNKNSGQSGAYFDIPIDKPSALTMPDGTTCTYTANDASVGDVDGDGEYEIILKWNPSNAQDNSKSGYTGNVYIDCYKLSGKKLWRIDLGHNIRAGAHYTQFMVYDYDGNGKAELVCKTADGTRDGNGTVIGDSSKDYRSTSGYILSGPEYLTLFEGATGKALDTIDYKPARGTVADWGDSYGNRVDRFTAATAYLDGQKPSVIMGRGYYTRLTLTAYDVVNNKLVERWAFDTGFNSSAAGYGDGNHNLMPADVDGDGKDELVCGSAVVDDNGKILYTSDFGHGDAMHVGDLVPSNPGLEIFMCHEDGAAKYGVSIRDGKTGNIILKQDASGDTGRCVADNLIAGNDGAEFCGSHDSIVYNYKGEKVCNWSDITKWGQNSVIYWTGDLERCVLDRTMADQYGKGRVFTADGAAYNNDSKSNACITCDLFGDWREEAVFPANDSTTLRVFGTTYTTKYNMFCLMDDTQYRCQVAGQNVAYNQPPHTQYFLESGKALPEPPECYIAGQ